MARMHALEPEALLAAVEHEQAQSCEQGVWASWPIGACGAVAWRADERHPRHHDAACVLLAEQNHARHQEVQIGRPERAGPADFGTLAAADPHQVDISLAVDLAAAQEERVDAALRRQIEQLDTAVGEKVVAP